MPEALSTAEAPLLIAVRARLGESHGTLRLNEAVWPCALGRAGIVKIKQEGDGGTPTGAFPLRRVFFRPDRLAQPRWWAPMSAISADDGWCDDPASPDYNRLVKLPHPARCERLWREDGLYDVLVELGYNDDPVAPGAGSAIFLHVAGMRDGDFTPTEGCIALARADLLSVLARCGPGVSIDIRPI